MNRAQKRLTSPRTSLVMKRNLSNTSISPDQSDKKPKLFITPKRSPLLNTDENNEIIILRTSIT